MMINDLRMKNSALANGDTLKERILENIFLVKLRNLELKSVRDLFDDELAALKASRGTYSTKENTSEHLGRSLIRMCLYYENTFNLASSLLKNCAKITSEFLLYAYRIESESHSIHQQAKSEDIKRMDPKLAGFLDRLNPALVRLCCEDGEMHSDIHDVISLLDLVDSRDIFTGKLAIMESIRNKIESVYQLVQEYLSFTDNHFASLI